MEEIKPIEYPKITIPGRGTVDVKFGLAAARILAAELHMTGLEALQILKEALPTEVDGKRKMGKIRLDFLFALMSACTWKTLRMSAEEIAAAYDDVDAPIFDSTVEIVNALISAMLKTKWSEQTALQGPATSTAEQTTPRPM